MANNTHLSTSLVDSNQMTEIVRPVLERLGRSLADPRIRTDIIADIQRAIDSNDLQAIRMFLSGHEEYWLQSIQWAYFQCFKTNLSLDDYQNWARVKCELLLAIARKTREDDFVIQHILNYEDFYTEVFPFSFGPTFIVDIYELRGLDFFLFHYGDGVTTAHSDGVLFDHAIRVSDSLRKLGRPTEASLVEKDIKARKERVVAIETSFPSVGYDPSGNVIGYIRVAGEKFWSDYLTPDVWMNIDTQSHSELVDAFSTEYLLKQGALSTWSTAVLALCKVIERETARAIFNPWEECFRVATWSPPQVESKKKRKRIESRFMTFKTMQVCASGKGHAPTLGQLAFIAKFWNDTIMDECTDLFRRIRTRTSQTAPSYTEGVAKLVYTLEEPHKMDGTSLTILDARNRSAHPRQEGQIDWPSFIGELKEALGKPPAELLKLAVELSGLAKAAQQGAAGDA